MKSPASTCTPIQTQAMYHDPLLISFLSLHHHPPSLARHPAPCQRYAAAATRRCTQRIGVCAWPQPHTRPLGLPPASIIARGIRRAVKPKPYASYCKLSTYAHAPKTGSERAHNPQAARAAPSTLSPATPRQQPRAPPRRTAALADTAPPWMGGSPQEGIWKRYWRTQKRFGAKSA